MTATLNHLLAAMSVMAVLVSNSAAAAETTLAVPSDSKAKYFVIERGGTADNPTLVTKRVGPSGTSYSKRQFDCRARTWKYLGDGETVDEMKRSKPDKNMAPLVSGSIADYLWRDACKRK